MKKHKNEPNEKGAKHVFPHFWCFLSVIDKFKACDLFICAGLIECVNPNLRMSSCSDVRLGEEILVTFSSEVKGGDVMFRVRFFVLLLVSLDELSGCFSICGFI